MAKKSCAKKSYGVTHHVILVSLVVGCSEDGLLDDAMGLHILGVGDERVCKGDSHPDSYGDPTDRGGVSRRGAALDADRELPDC